MFRSLNGAGFAFLSPGTSCSRRTGFAVVVGTLGGLNVSTSLSKHGSVRINSGGVSNDTFGRTTSRFGLSLYGAVLPAVIEGGGHLFKRSLVFTSSTGRVC